jgi:glycosyltransferase involved in cell wall biosynthesis
MTAPARVSVIVPVRNRARLLADLLAGLGAQTFTDFEVVVADDGSSDGSADVARAARCGTGPVRLVQGFGRGAVNARAAGVAAAAGDVLAFIDSDCVPDAEWLERGVAALDTGVDLVQGATYPFRPPRPWERSVWAGHEDGLYPSCNLLCRRSSFDAAGGFDRDADRVLGFRHGTRLRGLGFGEDTLLAWRIRRRGRVLFASDVVVRHQVLPSGAGDALARAWAAGAFPALVREVPELRATLGLRGGVVLGPRSRLLLYASIVALAARRRRLAAAAAAGWLAARVRPVLGADGSWRERLVSTPVVVAADAVTTAALVAGSVRARSVVL